LAEEECIIFGYKYRSQGLLKSLRPIKERSMIKKVVKPFGAWISPVKANLLASASISLGAVKVSEHDVYWLEGRPLEKGRVVLVRRSLDGEQVDITPPGFNTRTTVHEYGGGACFIHGRTVFISNFADQRMYRIDPGAAPRPITPDPSAEWGLRYADGRVTPDGSTIVCVRQRLLEETNHGEQAGIPQFANELVVLPADGSAEPKIIASGHDFYSNPRISPDGRKLAWMSWDHPNMPWDGTELWVADLALNGALSNPQRIAGGLHESIYQPEWGKHNELFFVSDCTNWWNLYAWQDAMIRPLAPIDAEFGGPQWSFGQTQYVLLSDGRIACIYSSDGIDHLGLIPVGTGDLQPIETGYTGFYSLATDGECLYVVAGSPAKSPALLRIEPDSGKLEVLKTSSTLTIDPGYISTPRPIEYPTENGLNAYALFYPPTNQDFTSPPGEKPPLIVISHGGPTGATDAVFSLGIQYWTSRGFGVVDVNYGGSTGYGRAYRQRLNGQWGVVDVQDCIHAARYLIAQGEADENRVVVRGGSAGGYTTLVALTMHRFFKAGASYFGIADLEPFAVDTHKFESRYLDSLIGPYPEAKQLYRQRSPIHYVDQIACPVILFQGLDDKVVPPSQADIMVRALEAKHLPYAYLPFEGEQHGFRKAENIQRCAEAELYFYSRVFGFDLGEPVDPVEIKNL
jgi:dipeptidyl aminopeptidase/acylaminoacyl peptidase